ncbi:HET-domain-containing protein [Hypoxylon sp. NC1633]|nr:HET-domain-containing protein [Hypoxylon sp. NC1633]
MPLVKRFETLFKGLKVGDTYEYVPLENPDRQIRILIVNSGSWTDTIECSVQAVFIDDNPQYEALSYVWGDPSKKRQISLDGHTIQVTENLFYALRRLRSASSTRTMWVDAVCINQGDNAEKSVQVCMMGTIYSRCAKTVIWLGEDLEATHKIRIGLSTPPVSQLAQRAGELLRILGQDTHMHELPCFKPTGQGNGLVAHPCFRDHFECLKVIYYAPWWTRIWIVQEMALPSEVTFTYASETYSYDSIRNLQDVFAKHAGSCCNSWWTGLMEDTAVRSIMLNIDIIQGELIMLRRSVAAGDNRSLWQLRSRFWSFEATNQRDLFYGLLGLVTNWNGQQRLIPDYNLPHATVVCSAVFDGIQRTRNLESMQGYRWLDDNAGLPTWLPDIRTSRIDRNTATLYRMYRNVMQRLFNASTLPCTQVTLVNDSVLRLQSVKVAAVKVVGDPMPFGTTAKVWVDRYPVLLQWMKLVGVRGWPTDAPADSSAEGQLWRALINDCVDAPPYRRATAEDYRDMQPYLAAVYGGNPLDRFPSGYTYTHFLALLGCVVYVTDAGAVGMGPANTQQGDEIHVIHGSKVPWILRPNVAAAVLLEAGIDVYSVVGDGYLHGVMDGEALKVGDARTVDLV